MLEEITSDQWAEWVEFAELEPWGFQIEDFRGAILASTVARAAGAKVAVKDFSLEPPPPPEQQERVDDGGVSELEAAFGGRQRNERA